VAFAGLVCGLHFTLGTLPRFARQAAGEHAATTALRELAQALETHHRDYGGYPLTLRDLGPAPDPRSPDCQSPGLIDGGLLSKASDGNTLRRWGYHLTYRTEGAAPPGTKGCAAGARTYALRAWPQAARSSGRATFLLEDGVIHYTLADRPATPADAALVGGTKDGRH
jgi:hypothetical protein